MASISEEGLAKMAEKMWGMLDTMAATSPEEYKKFVDEQIKEGKEHFSPPEGVYSLKCKNVRYRGNIYTLHINTARWNRVPYPPTDSDPIAVKGGTLRHCTNDNKITTCTTNNDDESIRNDSKDVSHSTFEQPTHRELVYDIAFNPGVIKECSKDPSMDSMLINLSLDFTQDVTGVIIDRESVVKVGGVIGHHDDIPLSLDDQLSHLLPKDTQISDTLLDKLSKMAATSNNDTKDSSSSTHEGFNNLPTLKLPGKEREGDRKPLIQVIEDVPSPSINNRKTTVQPPYKLSVSSDAISVTITLKGITSVNDMDLEVTENELILSTQNQSSSDYSLYLKFDGVIAVDSLKAQFNKATSILTVQADKNKEQL